MSIVSDMMAEVNRQVDQYRADRAARPDDFGHGDGCFDGTPEQGPWHLALLYKRDGDYKTRVLWHVYKYNWPMEYWYCIGTASDSRGERSDMTTQLDIRTLPKKYIGRYKLGGVNHRNTHIKVLERALADGFDLAAHIERLEVDERARAAERVQTRLVREAEGRCKDCGATPILASGYCTPCDEVPF